MEGRNAPPPSKPQPPSLTATDPRGFSATRPHDVAVIDGDEDYVAVGLGGTPAARATLGPGGVLLGHVVRARDYQAPSRWRIW